MSFLDQVFGSKPQVANLPFTDPLQELSVLLGGEIKDWPEISQLSNMYQQYMLGALNEAVPGFSDILQQGGIDTQATLQAAQPLIQGQIPQDVRDQVLRSAAFQSLGSGTLGGPMGSALQARDLGLTSLDLMNQGANLAASGGNAAQRWAGIAQGTMLPPSANLMNPMDYSNFIAQMRASEQAIQQQKYNVAAAPNPALQALNQWVEQLGGSIVGSLATGGMGGKGNYQTSYNPSQYGVTQQNPGFGANFSSALQGQPSQGLGGAFGSLFGNMFNQNYIPTTDMGVGSQYYGTVPGGMEVYGPTSFQQQPDPALFGGAG